VAFSIPFENDYPNILRILEWAKIPFRSSGRDSFQPLLIAGGVCPSFNPEPVAPVFDVIFIGEAEESLNEFLEKYKAVMESGHVKESAKKAALFIDGVYVPDFYTMKYHGD